MIKISGYILDITQIVHGVSFCSILGLLDSVIKSQGQNLTTLVMVVVPRAQEIAVGSLVGDIIKGSATMAVPATTTTSVPIVLNLGTQFSIAESSKLTVNMTVTVTVGGALARHPPTTTIQIGQTEVTDQQVQK